MIIAKKFPYDTYKSLSPIAKESNLIQNFFVFFTGFAKTHIFVTHIRLTNQDLATFVTTTQNSFEDGNEFF